MKQYSRWPRAAQLTVLVGLAAASLEVPRAAEFGPPTASPAGPPTATSPNPSTASPPSDAAPAIDGTAASVEVRALTFLAREIQQWRPQNNCFSCHNNGDGARALLAGHVAGVKRLALPAAGLPDWLPLPSQWNTNGPPGPFNDLKLARIQFAAAMAAASESGVARDHRQLVQAAKLLVADQIADGSWEFVGADEIGSPVTYGRTLATASSLRVLQRVEDQQFRSAITSAENWLLRQEPKSVLNAAATLWGLAGSRAPGADDQRDRCRSLIGRGEAPDGGWGPYLNARAEPFDTAVVLCALAESNAATSVAAIRRGRAYLKRTQTEEGSWPETTRPAERESYAQRLSTTAWATLALLATRQWETPSPQ